MSNQRYTPEFKNEAVRQVVERGHSVAEISERLGVSTHSLYKWVSAVRPDKSEQHEKELLEAMSKVLKLRAQLRRTEEERDILKKAARYFARSFLDRQDLYLADAFADLMPSVTNLVSGLDEVGIGMGGNSPMNPARAFRILKRLNQPGCRNCQGPQE